MASPSFLPTHNRDALKAKESGNRLPTVQNIDFHSPQTISASINTEKQKYQEQQQQQQQQQQQPPHYDVCSATYQQLSIGASQIPIQQLPFVTLAANTPHQNNRCSTPPPEPPPHAAASPLHSPMSLLPTAVPLAEFVPSQEGGERGGGGGEGEGGGGRGGGGGVSDNSEPNKQKGGRKAPILWV